MPRLILIFLFSVFASVTARAGELRMAVAANFTGVSQELIPLFEKHSGHRVKASYGSTGKLYAQIINGAPFDLFLAADSARPELLVKEGHATADSRFTYARGKLVLWSSTPGLFTDGMSFLQSRDFNKLAIANPGTAPYGLAAQQALIKLGLWEALKEKLVFGDSIAQTFQFTATGNATLGLIAAAQAKAWSQQGSQWEVPHKLHEPISQQAVLLTRASNNPAATAFISFLKSEEVKQRIRDHGYAVE
jgi:molybdate transport system substrate-binding protein